MKTSALIPLVAYLGLAGMSSAAPIQAAEAENHLDKRTFCFFGFGWGCNTATTTASAPAKTSAASSVVISSAAKSSAITSSSAAAKSSAVVVAPSSAKASSVASSASSAKAASSSVAASKTASADWAQCTDFDWTAWNDKEWTWGGGFSKDYVKDWYLAEYGLAPPPGMNWRQVSSLVSKFGGKTSVSGPKTTSRYSKGCSNPWTSAAPATSTKAATTTAKPATSSAAVTVAPSVSKASSSAVVSSASASPSKPAASSASASVVKPSASSAAGPAVSSAVSSAAGPAASSAASSAAAPVASSAAPSAAAPIASSAASSAAAPIASSAAPSAEAPASSSAAAPAASSAAVDTASSSVSQASAASPSPSTSPSDSGSAGNNTGVPGTGSGTPGSGEGSINGTSTTVAAPEATQPAAVTVNGYQYGGCAQEVAGRLLPNVQTSSASQTIESCTALCSSYGFAVAGLEYGNECYCGTLEDVENAAVSGECYMPCAGNADQICGGPNAINYYVDAQLTPTTVQLPAGWTTYGVVNEGTHGRLLSTLLYSGSDNTVETCAQGCAAAGFKVAGTEYSSECFCGNGFESSVGGGELVDESAAFMACSGNLAQKCGGPSILSITSAFGNNIPLV